MVSFQLRNTIKSKKYIYFKEKCAVKLLFQSIQLFCHNIDNQREIIVLHKTVSNGNYY